MERAPSKTSARGIGSRWEDAALDHLQKRGLRVLERNFTCRFGEIDLVMRDRDQIVFVEVRFRDSAGHGGGAPSVGPAKQAKLARAASLWLQAHAAYGAAPCRFDVVGCSGSIDAPSFEWICNAFDAF